MIMKKKALCLISLAMIGLAMTSCQKEEWADDTLLCSFENNDPKTHLAEGSDHKYITNKWDNTDALSPEQIMVVYPTNAPTRSSNGTTTGVTLNTAYVPYTAFDVRNDGKQAEFGHNASTTVNFNNMNTVHGQVELYYPAANFVSCTNKVDVTRSGTNSYNRKHTYANYTTSARRVKLNYYQNKNNSYSHDTRDWPMYGTVSETTDGGCRLATLYNLCGGLRLQLKSDDPDAAITKITVWTDNQPLVGEFILNTTSSTYEGHNTGETHLSIQTSQAVTSTGADNSNKNRIIYQPANDIVALSATDYTDFDICMPVGDYTSLHIRFEGVDGKYCVKTLNQSQLRIKRDELRLIQFDLDFTTPEGAVFAYYSVSPTKSVYFAKGNLRYNGTNHTHGGTWYFAEHQYDMLTSVSDIMNSSTGAYGRYSAGDGLVRHWMDGDGQVHNGTTWTYGANQNRGGARHTYYDNTNNNTWELFGWSSGAQDHYGVATERGSGSGTAQNGYYNNQGKAGFVDWGTLPIQNGGNQPYQWRTLVGGTYVPGRENYGEWDYLLNYRIRDGKIVYDLPSDYHGLNGQTKASWAIVRVNHVPGILLFSDRFNWAETGLSSTLIPPYLNVNPDNWTDENIIDYTYEQFAALEPTQHTGWGCTFLPAAGSREGYSTEQVCFLLRYWLASEPDETNAALYIGLNDQSGGDRDDVPSDSTHNLYWGRAVRLAMDAVPWDTRGTDNPWIEKGGNGSKGVATKAKAILRKSF